MSSSKITVFFKIFKLISIFTNLCSENNYLVCVFFFIKKINHFCKLRKIMINGNYKIETSQGVPLCIFFFLMKN